MTSARVGVNLLWLVPGDVGGSEESTVASLFAIAEAAPEGLSVELFMTDELAAAHPDLSDAFATHVRSGLGPSRARRMVAESTWLAARSRSVDLMHHAGGTAPPRAPVPYVLTVHDLQPLELSGTHSRFKRSYLRAMMPRSVRMARRVVVPSAFVKESVVRRFEVGADVVDVVPHGVSTHPAPTSSDKLVTRFELTGPVVLYPGITYPHKNHAVLVDAFAQLLTVHPDAVLVLTGREDSAGPALGERISALGLDSQVRRAGRVAAGDLAGLYRLASVVAFPSRYEGFGLPAAEALAYGTPLVASSSTSLPEVVGDAGILVDPDDVAGWADALASLIGLGPSEREDVARRGRERASQFSWAANAERLIQTYRKAIAAPG